MNQFIQSAIDSGALWLSGTPTRKLKSGRMSPYFFNSGAFSTGAAIAALGDGYAAALQKQIREGKFNFDVLFGPAYKGIPLAVAAASSLARNYNKNVEFAFDRKEVKDHGEQGDLIGATLNLKSVVIVDDVISKGDAKRGAYNFIKNHGGIPVAIVIAFDRQERGEGQLSAAQEIEQSLGIPVIASATTAELVTHLKLTGNHDAEVGAIETYLAQYGVK